MDEVDLPSEFEDALWDWGTALRRLREQLTDEMITAAWLRGIVAGTRLKFEHAKVWNGGKYPRKLPFVIEGPCPLGHRTDDRTDYAKVRFIIEESGWMSRDPQSQCSRCGPEDLERWALTCPRCEAGEDHERHYPAHSPLDVAAIYDIDHAGKPDGFEYDGAGGFDDSPVAWVMREFVRLARIAAARWWLEHTEDAVTEWQGSQRIREEDRQRVVSKILADSREVLGSASKGSSRAPVKPSMTPEAAAEWLDANGIAACGEKATWALVKDLPGCPAQAVIYAAVKVRKSRITSA